MTLTPIQKQSLKQKAHALKPIILLGQHGLTPAVQLEIERALLTHELVKIKIPGEDREERQAIAEAICQEREAARVQLIGKTLVIYRKKEEKEKPRLRTKRIVKPTSRTFRKPATRKKPMRRGAPRQR
ncbi:MAG: hypothetical protein A2X77_00985 [Gammaproteobacteria bacterium GWE2_42_36]|nr:MAG: hypothetical protein A2X77_00985 [Gammaproteobacteria bacterium GWE2_42_36]HCU05063.1 ribosome assembly RNA-binding protein YhbY [Coxiellaceae bacterium]